MVLHDSLDLALGLPVTYANTFSVFQLRWVPGIYNQKRRIRCVKKRKLSSVIGGTVLSMLCCSLGLAWLGAYSGCMETEMGCCTTHRAERRCFHSFS